MTYWTNPALEGRYGVASSFLLNDVQYPSGWLRTASPQEIADLGFVEDETLAVVPSLAVDRERDRRIREGTTVHVDGIGPIPLQGRPQDQLNMLALKDTARDLQAAGVTLAVIPFRDGANVEHLLTAEQMTQITDKGKQHITAIYQAAWSLKAIDPIPADYADAKWWP